MPADTEKPTIRDYVVDVMGRIPLTLEDPRMLAIAVLGFAAEDERYDADDRAACQEWLDRLVDSEGNPLDRRGRHVITSLMDEDTLASGGSLTNLFCEPDRVRLEFEVSRKAGANPETRDDVRARIVEHLTERADAIVAELYTPEASDGA